MLRKVRVRVCMCACLRECMLCERMSVLACVPGEKVRACATVCVCACHYQHGEVVSACVWVESISARQICSTRIV